jgi:hypothetical protein
MNTQEAFDTIVTHLAKQAQPAKKDDTDFCVYRSPEGLKCAVGCLIPDDLYLPAMDVDSPDDAGAGTGVEALIEHYPTMERLLCDVDVKVLCAAQDTHDHWQPHDWQTEVEEIAETYGLTVPPVDWSACEGTDPA